MFDMPIKITNNWDELLKNRDVIGMDLNGVIQNPTTGDMYGQADEVIRRANKLGIPIYVISNSTMGEEAFTKKLSVLGYKKGVNYQGVLSAGMAFQELLRSDPKRLTGINLESYKIHAVGHMFDAVLEGTPFKKASSIEGADFSYMGIPQISDDEYKQLAPDVKKGFTPSYIVSGNWDVLAENEDAVNYFYNTKIKGISHTIINANQDKIVDEKTPEGTVRLARQGFFAAMAEKDGKNLIKIGKHYPYIFSLFTQQVLKDTGKIKANVAYFGDNLSTDVAGMEIFKKVCPEMIDPYHSTSVLCLNDFWSKNDAAVANVQKLMHNNSIDPKDGLRMLQTIVGQRALDAKAVPDVMSLWNTEKGVLR